MDLVSGFQDFVCDIYQHWTHVCCYPDAKFALHPVVAVTCCDTVTYFANCYFNSVVCKPGQLVKRGGEV